MSLSTVSRVLLGMGVTLGVAAVAAMALDLRVNIPDWMFQVAMIKLAVIGSLGLLGAGAVLGRHAKRRHSLPDPDPRLLSEGSPDLTPSRSDKERVGRGSDSAGM